MANLQVKNVPDSLHERLRAYAQAHNRTLSEVVLGALEKEMARLEWHNRLASRPPLDSDVAAGALLEAQRECRDREMP